MSHTDITKTITKVLLSMGLEFKIISQNIKRDDDNLRLQILEIRYTYSTNDCNIIMVKINSNLTFMYVSH